MKIRRQREADRLLPALKDEVTDRITVLGHRGLVQQFPKFQTSKVF